MEQSECRIPGCLSVLPSGLAVIGPGSDEDMKNRKAGDGHQRCVAVHVVFPFLRGIQCWAFTQGRQPTRGGTVRNLLGREEGHTGRSRRERWPSWTTLQESFVEGVVGRAATRGGQLVGIPDRASR